jgi:hypothetical protein
VAWRWLRPGWQEPVQTESGAVKKAENLAKRIPGVAALKMVAGDETGELERDHPRAVGRDPGRRRREPAGRLTQVSGRAGR